MEAILPHVVGPAVGGVIAFVLVWFTIPRMVENHRAEVKELIDAFRESVRDLTGHIERLEQKVDRLRGPHAPRLFEPDPTPPRAA